jgi:hypothetical protein
VTYTGTLGVWSDFLFSPGISAVTWTIAGALQFGSTPGTWFQCDGCFPVDLDACTSKAARRLLVSSQV